MRTIWGLRTCLTFALAVGTAASAQGLKPVSNNTLATVRQAAPQMAVKATSDLRALRAPLHLTQDDDFAVQRTSTDQFGETHVRVQQTYRGLPVWGGAALVHYGPDGKQVGITDSLVRGIDVDTTSRHLSSDQALNAAARALAPKGSWSVKPTAELMVYPIGKDVLPADKDPKKVNASEVKHVVTGFALAYHVHTELANDQDGIEQTDLLINAKTGEVISKWSSLETAAAIGSGLSEYSGTVSLNTNDLGTGTFELRDLTRGSQVHPITGDNGITIRDMANGTSGFGAVVVDNAATTADNQWGDGANYVLANGSTSTNGQTAAVDAAYGLAETWDYYLNYYGRNGIDDSGTAAVGRVHASKNYLNAYWSDSCFCMTFGDGNVAQGYNTFTALDVVGHELSHGVTSRTAGLIYSGESGGLNEANSDIHGTMVEFYARGNGNIDDTSSGANWLIGEQISTNPSMPLRYMYKPSLDGISSDAWFPGIGNLDVHYSSGPMNRAFYFLSQGASADSTSDYYSPYLPNGMTGIGNSKAAAIWYRALVGYLLPWSNYVSARVAALHAAKDMFGSLSPEYAAVENAFAAINVGYSAGTFDDLYPPTVSVSAVENGPTATITADATDNVGVAYVDFYVDGHYVDTVQSAPFVLNLRSYDLTNGNHQVLAFAGDAANNYSYAFGTLTITNGYSESLVNGGFESGPSVGWTWSDSVYNSPFIFSSQSDAHGGSYLAWMNENGVAGTDVLSQAFTMPAGQAFLDYWLAVDSTETDGQQHGTFTVTIDDGTGAVQVGPTVDNVNTRGDWREYKYDLSAYAGKAVTLTFTGNESPATGATGFRLDDVSIRSYSGADVDAPFVTASEAGLTGPVTLDAQVSDRSLISKVEFWVDGSLVGAPLTAAPWTLTVDASTFTNGQHQLVVNATDSAGNVGSSDPVTFTIDNTFQQLVANPGFESWSVDANGNSVPDAWTESSTNPYGILPIADDGQLAHSGKGYAWLGGWSEGMAITDVVSQVVTIPSAPQSAILKFWFGSFTSESDGTVHDTFHFQVRDATGATVIDELATKTNLDADGYWHHLVFDMAKYAGQQVTLYFEADSDAATPTNFILDEFEFNASQADPPPAVSAWESGNGGMILLGGTVSDDGVVTQIEYLVDGAVISTRTNPPSKFAISYDSTLLADGSHSFAVRATDNTGLVTTSAPVSFATNNWMAGDTKAPQVALSYTENCAQTSFVVQASDDFALEEAELYIDGVFQGSAKGQPPYTLSLPFGALGPGPHTLLVNAIDGRGHHTVASLDFVHSDVVIDPVYSLVLAGSDQTFSGSSCTMSDATVSWSVEEQGGGAIDSVGHYVAPVSQGTYHVLATSVMDPSTTNTATVRVYNPDVDVDGTTDGVDMGQLAAAYGSKTGDANYSAAADLDGNGVVDDADLNLFLPQFGK